MRAFIIEKIIKFPSRVPLCSSRGASTWIVNALIDERVVIDPASDSPRSVRSSMRKLHIKASLINSFMCVALKAAGGEEPVECYHPFPTALWAVLMLFKGLVLVSSCSELLMVGSRHTGAFSQQRDRERMLSLYTEHLIRFWLSTVKRRGSNEISTLKTLTRLIKLDIV